MKTATNRYAIGTRAVITRGPHDHRVICATCDAGGTVPYRTREAALSAATLNSNKPCRVCGVR